jgi:hypothetical protein
LLDGAGLLVIGWVGQAGFEDFVRILGVDCHRLIELLGGLS